MPLVRITTNPGSADGFGRRVGDAVHAALVDALAIPEGDHFQVISEGPDQVVYDPAYLDIARSDGFVLIQITLARGRSVQQKKALYARITDLLEQRLAVRPQDVFVSLVEVGPEDWSFGNGVAQYADVLPPHLR